MGAVGMANVLIDRIMTCIFTPEMQVLWNGGLSEAFTTSRGVRQGDSLSPYIFVLYMERLAHGISVAVEKRKWKGVRLGSGGPILSHFFFADDIFLFAEASIDQVEVIKNILEEFKMCYGKKVNKSKTKCFLSNNVNSHIQREISRSFVFDVTKDLSKYLGSLLLHKRIYRDNYKDVSAKLRTKLTGWKTSQLS
ncbi:hypothetical protein Syun_020704 [Stephania yunnanensis]|uniref:Reverse transcriptase domain-containing protein n=1 Tax=Stephania yunnanensis TaxID=152371 RepID=A0AAP0IEP9_9MAGN